MTVTVQPGLPMADYLAIDAVSSTVLRTLDAATPLHARHRQLHAEPPKLEYDLGSAVHDVLLERGDRLDVCDYDSWRTKAAQQDAAEARAAGRVPLLTRQATVVQDMAKAARAHPRVGALLAAATHREVTITWDDPDTGLPCKARPDFLAPGVLVDYKTAGRVGGASYEKASRALAEYGYDLQAEHYRHGVVLADQAGLLPAGPAPRQPVLIFQETTAPYAVAWFVLSEATMMLAFRRRRALLRRWAECVAEQDWPGYPPDAQWLEPPAWTLAMQDAADARGDYDDDEGGDIR